MDVALIFAGGDPLPRGLVDDLPTADLVVAADSGYDTAMANNHRVDVLIGDLDSISDTNIPGHVVIERHPPDKDASDLELALELVARESPSRIVVAGGSGGRLDHEIAIATLVCSPRWDLVDEIDWISERGVAHVITGRRIIHGDVGDLLTLIPMHGDASGITARGLRWPLNDETLPAGSTRGLSNVMESPVADIRVTNGRLLAIRSPLSR